MTLCRLVAEQDVTGGSLQTGVAVAETDLAETWSLSTKTATQIFWTRDSHSVRGAIEQYAASAVLVAAGSLR